MGHLHKIGSHRHNCLDRSRSSFSSINNRPPLLTFLPLLNAHPPTPSQLVPTYLPTYLPTHSLTHSLTHSPRLAQLSFSFAQLFLCFFLKEKETKKERKPVRDQAFLSLSLSSRSAFSCIFNSSTAPADLCFAKLRYSNSCLLFLLFEFY